MTVDGLSTAENLRKRSLYEEVYDRLKEDISAGRLESGTVLLEAPLAELLGSSRTPIRQALRLLADDGMLSRFDGRGFVVGPPGTEIRRVDVTRSLGHLAESKDRPLFAWQGLYEDVERIVVYHSFFGRFRISEVDLARYYGVGRTVARDVLLRLETLGITEKDEHFRWSVVPLDDARITDLYEVREHIEPLAISRAAEAVSVAEIDRMMKRLTAALHAYPDVSAAQMYDLELDLHVRCMRLSPNKELPGILQRTQCLLTLSKHVMGVQMAMPEYEPFLGEHMTIFRAMRRGDQEAMKLAMRDHIHGSLPKLLQRAETVRRTYRPDACPFIV